MEIIGRTSLGLAIAPDEPEGWFISADMPTPFVTEHGLVLQILSTDPYRPRRNLDYLRRCVQRVAYGERYYRLHPEARIYLPTAEEPPYYVYGTGMAVFQETESPSAVEDVRRKIGATVGIEL